MAHTNIGDGEQSDSGESSDEKEISGATYNETQQQLY